MAAKDKGVLPGDIHVRGHLTADSMSVPSESVGNLQWDPGSPLSAINQDHQHMPLYQQKTGIAVAAWRQVMHVAQGDGELVAVKVGVVTKPIGDSTVSVDIYKNGVTVLSGPKVINNAVADYGVNSASVSDNDVAADDVFEVVVTISAGTGTLPQGLFVQLVLRESAEGA